MKISGMQTMNDRQRLLFLILILAIVALFTTGVTNYFLYNAAFEQNRERLLVSAQSQARIMEAVARFDEQYRTGYPNGATAATISQIEEAHDNFELFGKTGEFTIARREKNRIVFLFRQHQFNLETPKPVPFDSEFAEPMRQALLGKSGTLVGLDYQGDTVLAAFEPVSVLNLGIVAKIDMAEIRAPFIETGIITGVLALAAIIAGAFLFARTTTPMFRRIQESEELFRSLAFGSPAGIFKTDRDGHCTYVNSKWSEIAGITLEEALDSGWVNGIHPEDQEHVAEEWYQAVQACQPFLSEYRFQRKDGHTTWVQGQAAVLLDEHGQVAGYVGTITDVTARKLAEETLRKLSHAVEQSPATVMITNIRGELEYVNPKFTETTGYSAEEVIGQNPRILKSGYTPPDKYDRLWQTITAGGEWRGVFYNRRKDGTHYWEAASISAIKAQDGSIINFIAVKEDITERKQMEEELIRHRDQLEEIVEERTKELRVAQEQLVRREKMAALGQLAGGVGHDLNNILFPIMGFSELLLEQFPTDSQEYSYLKMIADSAQRGKDLISQILAFSNRSEGKREACDLKSVLQEVMKLIRATLPVTITIHERIEDANLIFADSTQMHQVLMNLCINAGQAMPDGGELDISLENVELDEVECYLGKRLSGPHVRISVADTGVGMDEYILAHLFDPFFTTKDVNKGTGLGLSTVLGIVLKHGGGICVTSQPGMGSTFEVLLPAFETAEGEAIDSQIPDLGGTESILFIDDEKTIAHLGRVLLEKMGYRVTALTSSIEALELFKTDPDRFDLVITDQTMPDLTGANLSQKLREIRHDIPIILCTGFSDTVTHDVANNLGINEFVYKPIRQKDLGRIVRKVLGNGK